MAHMIVAPFCDVFPLNNKILAADMAPGPGRVAVISNFLRNKWFVPENNLEMEQKQLFSNWQIVAKLVFLRLSRFALV